MKKGWHHGEFGGHGPGKHGPPGGHEGEKGKLFGKFGHGPMGGPKGDFFAKFKGKFPGKFPGKSEEGTTGRPATTDPTGAGAKSDYEAQINGLGDSDFPLLADVNSFGPSAGAAAGLDAGASVLGSALSVLGVIGGLYLLSHMLPLGRR